MSKFPVFFSANFCICMYFNFFSPIVGMRRVPNILPSIEFLNFGNVSCLSRASYFFLEKKRRKIWGKVVRQERPPPEVSISNQFFGT